MTEFEKLIAADEAQIQTDEAKLAADEATAPAFTLETIKVGDSLRVKTAASPYAGEAGTVTSIEGDRIILAFDPAGVAVVNLPDVERA